MIEDLIRQLLYRKDCVIIPGLGGFVSNEEPAQIHPITHTFSPPKKKIAFNSKLTRDDGTLAGSLVDAQKITYSQAASEVKAFSKSLKTRLETEKEVTLEGLGRFYHDHGEELQFELMDNKSNYNDKSFGLPELYHKPIERKEMPKIITRDRPPSNRPVGQRARSKAGAWAIVVLLGLLVIGSIASLFVFERNKSEMSSLSPIPAGTADYTGSDPALVMTPDEGISSEDQESYNDRQDMAVEEQATVPPAIDKSEKTSGQSNSPVGELPRVTERLNRYYIIVGGYANEKSAERHSTKLRKEGVPSRVVNPTPEIDLYRVTLGDFDRLNPAIKKMESLRNTYGNEIWVLTF